LEVGFDFSYFDEQRLATKDTLKEVPNTTWAMVFAVLAGLVGGVMLALIMEILAKARGRHPF